jgi:polysaccharide export outer membrane protein
MAAALYLAGCVASSGDNTALNKEAASDTVQASSFAESSKPAPVRAIAATTSATVDATAARSGEAHPVSELQLATAAGTPGSEGYRVGPLDVLTITVFKVDDLNKTVQVSESGKFGFPLVGEVQASGRTVSEIERDLAAKLGGQYLRNPQVTVLISQYNSQRITVEGSVKKPGVFPMQGPMTLLQTIAMAGGTDEVAEGTLIIFRKVEGKSSAAKFNMGDLRAQKVDDPDLRAGDIVMVPSSDVKVGLQYILRAVPLFNAFMVL